MEDNDVLEDLLNNDREEEVKTAVVGWDSRRFIPPTLSESNVPVKGQFIRGGTLNRFGQKDPGGKPVLLPAPRIESKDYVSKNCYSEI